MKLIFGTGFPEKVGCMHLVNFSILNFQNFDFTVFTFIT